jgi:hypothetical protein
VGAVAEFRRLLGVGLVGAQREHDGEGVVLGVRPDVLGKPGTGLRFALTG